MIHGSRCAGCGATWAPPVLRCARCGSVEVHAAALSGTGTVRSFTWVHTHARSPSPWGLTHVESDEGVLVIGLAHASLVPGERASVVGAADGLPVYVAGDRR